jgi:hypothetical protein
VRLPRGRAAVFLPDAGKRAGGHGTAALRPDGAVEGRGHQRRTVAGLVRRLVTTVSLPSLLMQRIQR